MNIFEDDKATADELWNYYMEEYQNQNPIVKTLINTYYKKIALIIADFKPDFRLLEVGCATGESSRRIGTLLNEQHFEVSEYDARLVTKMIENGFPYKVIQESVYSLLREDNSFDAIFFLEVLEHLGEVEKALQELFRVSKKYVVISVPNEPVWSALNFMRGKYWSNLGNTPGHINQWSLKSIKKLVSKYGKIIKTYSPVPWNILLIEKI